MITINPNAQASILIDEPTISAGEKILSFFFLVSTILYFCSEQKSYFESNAKQSAEMSTVAKSLPQIPLATQTAFI